MSEVDAGWVALSGIRGMGAATLTELVRRFGDAAGVLAADDATLLAVPRVGKKTLAAIREVDLAATRCQLEAWIAQGVTTLPLSADAFPDQLRPPLPDAPAILYVRGALPYEAGVAIVGTRRPSDAGVKIAHTLGKRLAAAGYIVVSGLALGIDGAAHQGALDIPNGQTVAVLGSGVLNVYPPEHTDLAAEIVARGALVSEVAPDVTVSTPWLVARNRLISALAEAVIIVETADDGGAMHAARAAYKQGRRLIALDAPHTGNQLLIREGHAAPLALDLTNLAGVLSHV
ncbi:MAG: DNA-processing protein DprA [Chloroflexota bacterium]